MELVNHYNYLDYRKLIADQIKLNKRQRSGWTMQRLAERCKIQAPYLTHVLKGRAHLSADQMQALGSDFDWTSDEIDYGILLLEWDRAAHPVRRRSLHERIEQIRKTKLSSQSHLRKAVVNPNSEEFSRFFLNPFYSLINAFIGIPRFAKDPRLIGKCLGVDSQLLQVWIKDLVEMGFLEATPQGYVKIRKNFHLPKTSPLCEPHQNLSQQIASYQMATLPAEEKYNFTVTVSANPATREAIQLEFMQFLKRIEPLVAAAPAEELYGIRFDIFRWTHEKSLQR